MAARISGRDKDRQGRSEGNDQAKYQKFLTGRMSARRLCHKCGLDDLANVLVPVLWGLQNGHDNIVHREARNLVLDVLRALRAGNIQAGAAAKAQVVELLGLDPSDLDRLEEIFAPVSNAKAPPHYAEPPRTRKELLALYMRVVERARSMTTEELFQSMVRSGIYTAEGQLAPEYGGPIHSPSGKQKE